MKAGKLDAEEQAVMRTHTTLGRQLVEEITKNFGLQSLEQRPHGRVPRPRGGGFRGGRSERSEQAVPPRILIRGLLQSVAELHHEAMDGSGYPKSLRGDEIPIAARIIAVADVFDALTSERPYKRAWSNDDGA